MKNKFWAITAGVLIACGVCFALLGMALVGFDFDKISADGKKAQNTHIVKEEFDSIHIDTSTADVFFEVSEGDEVKVVLDEAEKRYHTVEVDATGTLQIREVSKRKWYDFFNMFGGFGKKKIVVYLPEKKAEGVARKLENAEPAKFVLQNLTIDISTGDVHINDMAILGNELKVDGSTGKIIMNNVTAPKMDLDCSTGDITLQAVEVQGEMRIDASTGDVSVLDSDAGSVKIDVSTGDITCRFLSGKNVKASTSTGKVRLAEGKTESGGECILNTSTGDIKVE